MTRILELDTLNNVAVTDDGDFLQIETYYDDEDTPCLPEEARSVMVRSGSTSYIRVELLNYDEDY